MREFTIGQVWYQFAPRVARWIRPKLGKPHSFWPPLEFYEMQKERDLRAQSNTSSSPETK